MPNWSEILGEIQKIQIAGQRAHDIVRRQYLDQLYHKTGRNVIAYYSGFLSKPGISGLEINDEDKDAFMMTVHKMTRRLGLDLILHTPGGSVASAQSIVDYLRKMFGNDIRAIIPQIAMSAGTMIACSCSEIMMAKHSNLGPIDPHLRGVPAYGIVKEFKRAINDVKANPATAYVWQHIIGQYKPAFLSQCENAIKWAKSFVEKQLEECMFDGDPNARKKAQKIAHLLSDYSKNKSHERHIHAEECRQMGLKITDLEADSEVQDLVLSVHHCYMHALMNTSTFKITENHIGVALIKNQQIIGVPAGGPIALHQPSSQLPYAT